MSVFSLLNNSFNDRQEGALEDSVETSQYSTTIDKCVYNVIIE